MKGTWRRARTMKEHYSKALKMSYKPLDRDGTHHQIAVRFKDGVEYDYSEMMELAVRYPGHRHMRVIHEIKKLFEGRILCLER